VSIVSLARASSAVTFRPALKSAKIARRDVNAHAT